MEHGGGGDDDTVIPQQNQEDFGKFQYGCEHYRRRCRLRSPCCDQIFSCRHCHNSATSTLSNPKDRHELVRSDVSRVICAVCDTEQQVAHVCSKCGVKMGEYFCEICRFYDDDITKEQFHCDDCGICRVGGRENFFHCKKCEVSNELSTNANSLHEPSKRRPQSTASCYSVDLLDNHLCVGNSMKNHCPICYEYLFDSVQSTTIMKCGHTMHKGCFKEMIGQNQYRCPICSKSVLDMSRTWERLDLEIDATAMPEEYHYEVPILCNDCNNTSKAFFHIIGHKCNHCKSYNTRVIGSTDHQQQSYPADQNS